MNQVVPRGESAFINVLAHYAFGVNDSDTQLPILATVLMTCEFRVMFR
jgi:hypothetical protein